MYTSFKRMRKRGGGLKRLGRAKKTGVALKRYALIVLVALVLPLCANFLRPGAGYLTAFGERAASVGAVLNMPGAGLKVLLERFEDVILPEKAPELHIPQAPVVPAAPEEEAPPPAEESAGEEIPGGVGATAIPPRIPSEFRGELISENFSGKEAAGYLRAGAGLIRNSTDLSDKEVFEILDEPGEALSFEEEPQVLIYHTHATESFERYDANIYDTRNTWRSTDNNLNMVAVGAVMAKALEDEGITVFHDTTQHDYPSYNGSYENSAETVASWLKEYPNIRFVLDLHRDAMEREGGVIVKPVAEVEGARLAQIMIIAGCDDGTMNMPNWPENLRLAAAWQNVMERDYPGLTRPVLFSYRKYNQDLSPGALLVEFGTNANTLEESVRSAELAAKSLAALIRETAEE
jgi:stage II sporulation protein P